MEVKEPTDTHKPHLQLHTQTLTSRRRRLLSPTANLCWQQAARDYFHGGLNGAPHGDGILQNGCGQHLVVRQRGAGLGDNRLRDRDGSSVNAMLMWSLTDINDSERLFVKDGDGRILILMFHPFKNSHVRFRVTVIGVPPDVITEPRPTCHLTPATCHLPPDTCHLPPVTYPMSFHSGFVCILGRPNAGKSTLLNALVGEKLAIISPKPQTTRNRILGIINVPKQKGREAGQIVLIDTPGVHQSGSSLGRKMMSEVREALEGCELILMIVDARRSGTAQTPSSSTWRKKRALRFFFCSTRSICWPTRANCCR